MTNKITINTILNKKFHQTFVHYLKKWLDIPIRLEVLHEEEGDLYSTLSQPYEGPCQYGNKVHNQFVA